MERAGKRKIFIILRLLAVMSVLAVFGCGALRGQALAEVAAVSEESAAHDHNDGEWTALTADGGVLTAGKYYLADDVTLTTDLTISGEVTLCLNGHKLTGTGKSSVITVNSDANFTLCDCSTEANNVVGGVTYTTGVVTGGSGFYDGQAYSRGGGVYVAENASFTLTGGSISGNSVEYGEGGGVYISEGSTFTMSGGSIAVVKDCRRQGVGVFLIKEAEKIILEKGGGRALIHAQARAKEFYFKQGYLDTGKSDEEEGCPHIWLYKNCGQS